jgi:hypothetical protein
MAEVMLGITPTQIKASTDMEPLTDIRLSAGGGVLVYMELHWVDEEHVHVALGPGYHDPSFIVDATMNLMHIFCNLMWPANYTVTEYRFDTGSVADPDLLLTMQLAELRAFKFVRLEIFSQ